METINSQIQKAQQSPPPKKKKKTKGSHTKAHHNEIAENLESNQREKDTLHTEGKKQKLKQTLCLKLCNPEDDGITFFKVLKQKNFKTTQPRILYLEKLFSKIKAKQDFSNTQKLSEFNRRPTS